MPKKPSPAYAGFTLRKNAMLTLIVALTPAAAITVALVAHGMEITE